MSKIIVYTTKMCPYCVAAKKLLKKKGASFEEIDVTFDRNTRQAMSRKAGGQTSVPQIFIGETHVGGCDDLFELDGKGALDLLLEAS